MCVYMTVSFLKVSMTFRSRRKSSIELTWDNLLSSGAMLRSNIAQNSVIFREGKNFRVHVFMAFVFCGVENHEAGTFTASKSSSVCHILPVTIDHTSFLFFFTPAFYDNIVVRVFFIQS